MKLALVTASINLDRSGPIRYQWPLAFGGTVDLYTIYNGALPSEGLEGWLQPFPLYGGGRSQMYLTPEILGVVPAFALGVQQALEKGAEIIACIHDDLEIRELDVGRRIVEFFTDHPKAGLLGFGGGRGLGADQIYQTPYDPMQLARRDFISNMVDAEAHGRRVMVPTRVAALDGFSQVGRREFWLSEDPHKNLFTVMAEWGIVHHYYDGCLGCFAARHNWEAWMLPIACHHLGGQTAVGDARYAEWAKTKHTGGDAGFWEQAHRIGYARFRDVMPIPIGLGVVCGSD